MMKKSMKMNVMNKLSAMLVGISISVSVFAQSGFEGVITYNTTNASIKEKATVTWYHKNGNNLMEFDSKAGDEIMKYEMIMDSNSETVYLKANGGGQEISGIQPEEIYTAATFVRKMQTKEGDYECEMLMFKSNGNDLTYWVTNDVGLSYKALPKLMRNNMPKMAGISDGFPLKMELRDMNGNLLRSQEVISVEKKPVDDSKFKK